MEGISLGLPTLIAIALYLAGINVLGAWLGKGQKDAKDYFLGGRTAPWWAIGLSIVSAETSTLTIVGTPALAFGGNLGRNTFRAPGFVTTNLSLSKTFCPFTKKCFDKLNMTNRALLGFSIVCQSTNHQIIKSPNHQIIKSPNHQITKSTNHQIGKSNLRCTYAVPTVYLR